MYGISSISIIPGKRYIHKCEPFNLYYRTYFIVL
nr:MAG TPA: hypothetical protein [Caudoviricetes sp.]